MEQRGGTLVVAIDDVEPGGPGNINLYGRVVGLEAGSTPEAAPELSTPGTRTQPPLAKDPAGGEEHHGGAA